MECVIQNMFTDNKQVICCYTEDKDVNCIFYIEVFENNNGKYNAVRASEIEKGKQYKFFINRGLVKGKSKPEIKHNFCYIMDKLFDKIENNGWKAEVVVNNKAYDYYTNLNEEKNFYTVSEYFRAYKKTKEIDEFDSKFKNFPIYIDKHAIKKYMHKKEGAFDYQK